MAPLSRGNDAIVLSSEQAGAVSRILFELIVSGAVAARVVGEGFAEVAGGWDVAAGCICYWFDAARSTLHVGTASEVRLRVEAQRGP